MGIGTFLIPLGDCGASGILAWSASGRLLVSDQPPTVGRQPPCARNCVLSAAGQTLIASRQADDLAARLSRGTPRCRAWAAAGQPMSPGHHDDRPHGAAENHAAHQPRFSSTTGQLFVQTPQNTPLRLRRRIAGCSRQPPGTTIPISPSRGKPSYFCNGNEVPWKPNRPPERR